MAKLTILATALIALFALAQASRTTITTTVVEEENPGQQQRCREQIQRQQNLQQCQTYLRQQGRRYDAVMITDLNPQQQEQLQRCCQQLENLDEQCRCDGLREAVRQQRQQQGERQGEEMREIMEQAESLPSMCNLSPQRCQIQAALF